MDDMLQRLIDAPLADPLKLNLPMGRRPGIRGSKLTYEGEFAPEKLTAEEVRDRRRNAVHDRESALLDYYAGTSVPFDRIAAHTGLAIDVVTKAMNSRGREA